MFVFFIYVYIILIKNQLNNKILSDG